MCAWRECAQNSAFSIPIICTCTHLDVVDIWPISPRPFSVKTTSILVGLGSDG